MKEYRRKVTATASAILIALTLVGLNSDQAIAQGKAGKSIGGELVMEGHIKKAEKVAKVRTSSNAKISQTPGPKQTITMMDYVRPGETHR